MADVKNDVIEEPIVEEVVAEKGPTVEELLAKLEEKEKAIEALASKKDELLKETKAAKEEKRKQADEAEQAKRLHAEKNGEYEKLWKSAEEEKEKFKTELSNYKKDLRDQAIDIKAEKIALELTNKDPSKAELLKVFIQKSINNVADEQGNVENDVLQSISKQISADSKYSPLLGVNKSVGGSAQGNSRSASTTHEATRGEFDKMSHAERRNFLSNKGKVTD